APGLEALGVVLHKGLDVGGKRHGLLDPRDRVHHAHLDRAEAGMEPDVPPDMRVVGDAAGLLQLADDLRVIGIVPEAGRGPRARERGEDHLAARGEPGRLTAPKRRVRGEGEKFGQVEEERARDLDRLFRVVDRDMDVQTEDELAARDVLELVDEIPVAVSCGDALALEEAERVRAGGAYAHAALARDPA